MFLLINVADRSEAMESFSPSPYLALNIASQVNSCLTLTHKCKISYLASILSKNMTAALTSAAPMKSIRI